MLIMSLHVNFIIIYRKFIQVFPFLIYPNFFWKKPLRFLFFQEILRRLLVMNITIAVIIRIVNEIH